MMLRDLLQPTRTILKTVGECMVSFALSHSAAQVCWLWIKSTSDGEGPVAVFCLLCVVEHICSRFSESSLCDARHGVLS
jgi:hypothetical protein